MVVYTDTSFLFSLYADDINSERACQVASKMTQSILATDLQLLELRNALRLSPFRGHMSATQLSLVLDTIEKDLKSGILRNISISWPEVYTLADNLSAAHTTALGNRTIDILHVASAMVLKADKFYTFDSRQLQLAQAVNLNTDLN